MTSKLDVLSAPPSSKVCTVCRIDKSLDDFRIWSAGGGRFGRRPLCKECQRIYELGWRSQSKEYRRKQRLKRFDKNAEYSREYRALNRIKYIVAQIRRRSKTKGIPFDLEDHLEELNARCAKGVCELSGIPLNMLASRGQVFNNPSIDRINPKGDYIYANVRVVAWAVNAMLGSWGEEVTLNIARNWLQKRELDGLL